MDGLRQVYGWMFPAFCTVVACIRILIAGHARRPQAQSAGLARFSGRVGPRVDACMQGREVDFLRDSST
jgi:hypothetical protein